MLISSFSWKLLYSWQNDAHCHHSIERTRFVFNQNCASIFVIVQASLVECYRNHTTTRIRIQTAGLAFGGTGLCSCCVRGVDGSCAKHLTVESYMDIYASNGYTYAFLLPISSSPTLFHSRLQTFFFCKSFTLQPFFFFFRTDYMILQTFTVTSSTGCFYFLVFLFYSF